MKCNVCVWRKKVERKSRVVSCSSSLAPRYMTSNSMLHHSLKCNARRQKGSWQRPWDKTRLGTRLGTPGPNSNKPSPALRKRGLWR